MRIAAGVLMVIFGAWTMALSVAELVEFGDINPDRLLSVSLVFVAAIITTGGILCIRRRYWKLCFISSLLLLLLVVFFGPIPFAPLPFGALSSLLAIVVPVLPLIFVCVRRREWQALHV